jgi:hypothetical protein
MVSAAFAQAGARFKPARNENEWDQIRLIRSDQSQEKSHSAIPRVCYRSVFTTRGLTMLAVAVVALTILIGGCVPAFDQEAFAVAAQAQGFDRVKLRYAMTPCRVKGALYLNCVLFYWSTGDGAAIRDGNGLAAWDFGRGIWVFDERAAPPLT